MTLGIDISSNNGSVSVDLLKKVHPNLTVLGVKSDEGLSYRDPYFTTNFDHADAAGLVVVAYHFAHPDSHPGMAGGVEEANYFLNDVWHWKDRKAFGRPALDYESANDPVFAEAFCRRIEQKLGAKPLVYVEGSRTSEIASRPYLKSCPLWVAAYGPSYTEYVPAGMKAWMWQYSQTFDGRFDASQVFVHPDQLRVHHEHAYLVVTHEGKKHWIKAGGGRVRTFLHQRLPTLIRSGRRIILRRRVK